MDIEMPGFKGFEATKADDALYNPKENGRNRIENA
jgi:PleD family two-component response regulator